MKNYAKLIQEQVEVMKAVFSAAEAEDRLMSEDEQHKYDDAKAKIEDLKAMEKQQKELGEIENSIPVHVPADVTDAQSIQASVGKNLSNAKPYNNIGQILKDVANKSQGDQNATERLVNANLNTQADSDGATLIGSDMMSGLMDEAMYNSQIFADTREINVSQNSNTVTIPGVDETSRASGQRFGGIKTQWVAEGKKGDYSGPKYDSYDLKLSKLMSLTTVTDEMLQDSTFLNSWFMMAFPSDMAFELDDAVYNGSGVGKPLGVVNDANKSLVTVAKEASQSADTIVYENIVKMHARMPAWRKANAKWYVTPQALEQFPLMNLSVGTGGAPVYLPNGGASESPYSTLFSRPVVPLEQAKALGDKGDILFADMSDYISVVKGGIKEDSSIHVLFDKAETAFRFIKRVNGAPYTRTTVSPANGSDFITSPYITLAERA